MTAIAMPAAAPGASAMLEDSVLREVLPALMQRNSDQGVPSAITSKGQCSKCLLPVIAKQLGTERAAQAALAILTEIQFVSFGSANACASGRQQRLCTSRSAYY